MTDLLELDYDMLSEVTEEESVKQAPNIDELSYIQKQSTRELEIYISKELSIQLGRTLDENKLSHIEKDYYDYVKEYFSRSDASPKTYLRNLHRFVSFRIGKIIDYAKTDNKEVEDKLSKEELDLLRSLREKRMEYENNMWKKIMV